MIEYDRQIQLPFINLNHQARFRGSAKHHPGTSGPRPASSHGPTCVIGEVSPKVLAAQGIADLRCKTWGAPSVATMRCPSSLAKLVYKSYFIMVYGTYYYSYWGLSTNV